MARWLNRIKWVLLPLGVLHGLVVWCRNRLYDVNGLALERLPQPVISVGNLQLGGTGKTPLVALLIEALEARGFRIGVLTRGYRRRGRGLQIVPAEKGSASVHELGDEPLLLFRRMRRGVLAVGADRCRAGKELLVRYPVDGFLLDDGFQYRRMVRDLDICLIDLNRWPAHPFLVPFSNLRDVKSSLHRADIVLFTGPQAMAERLRSRVGHSGRNRQHWFACARQPAGWVDLRTGCEFPVSAPPKGPAAAVCGIAKPGAFWETLNKLHLNPLWRRKFPDHHRYSRKDVRRIIGAMHYHGLKALLTTEKDAVKLEGFLNMFPPNITVYVLKIELQVEQWPRLLELVVARLQQLQC